MSDYDQYFDTPQKRLLGTAQLIEALVKTETKLSQADVDKCRDEIRLISNAMIAGHSRIPGAGAKIDRLRATCDMFDAVFAYMRKADGG